MLQIEAPVTKTKRSTTNDKINETVETQEAFPTEAKVKEKATKKKMQLDGKAIIIGKRPNYAAGRHDGRGHKRPRRQLGELRRHFLSQIWLRHRSDIFRYAGTSSRCSQKLLVSEAVRRKWDLATTDISKAFLQGVTYEDLAKLTGERCAKLISTCRPATYHSSASSKASRTLTPPGKSYIVTSLARGL